jgi:hypothetical protein
LKCFPLLLLAASLSGQTPAGPCSNFYPNVVPRLVPVPGVKDVRKLAISYAFKDPRALQWIAPLNLETDGASIPRIFKRIIGDHWNPQYLRGAIIHDAYYTTPQGRARGDADRMLYDSITCDGTSPTKAKLIFLAVRIGGVFCWNHGTRKGAEAAGNPSGLQDLSAGLQPPPGMGAMSTAMKAAGFSEPDDPLTLTWQKAQFRAMSLPDLALDDAEIQGLFNHIPMGAERMAAFSKIMENRIARFRAFKDLQQLLVLPPEAPLADLVASFESRIPSQLKGKIDFRGKTVSDDVSIEALARILDAFCPEQWDEVKRLGQQP